MATSTSTFARPKLPIWFAVSAHGCKLPELAVYTCLGPTDTRDHNSMTTPHLHSFVTCESPRIRFLYYSHNLIRHLFEVWSPRTLISASRTYRYDVMSIRLDTPLSSSISFTQTADGDFISLYIDWHVYPPAPTRLGESRQRCFFIIAFIRPYYFCLLEQYMLSGLMILTTKAYVERNRPDLLIMW